MQITRRIHVSMPADHWLPANLNALKWGVVEEIEKLGYTAFLSAADPVSGPQLVWGRA